MKIRKEFMDIVMESENKEVSGYFKKHVDLILSKNNMTLTQRQAFNVLLHNAIPDLPHNNLFQISLWEIGKKIGYKSRNLVALANAVAPLGKLNFNSRIVDSKTKAEDIIEISISPFQTFFLSDGKCTYRINEDIKNQLMKPGIYARLDLTIQSMLGSCYALVLYEICEKYRRIGNTGWFSLDDFRSLMGVDKKKYKLFADFEKKVILKAVNEVNDKTDFFVSCEKHRKGRAVDKIRFIISSKKLLESLDSKNKGERESIQNRDETSNNKLIEQLIEDFAVNEKVAIDICQQYEASYIAEKISVVKESDTFKTGTARNLGGLIVRAIQKDFKQPKSSKDAVRQEQKKRYEAKKAEDERHKKQEAVNNEYIRYINSEVDSYIEAISNQADLIEGIRSGFLEYCNNRKLFNQARKYKKDYCYKSNSVRGIFNQYMMSSVIVGKIDDKETFMEKRRQTKKVADDTSNALVD